MACKIFAYENNGTRKVSYTFMVKWETRVDKGFILKKSYENHKKGNIFMVLLLI